MLLPFVISHELPLTDPVLKFLLILVIILSAPLLLNKLKIRHSCISPWQYNHVIQRLWTL